MRFFIFFLLLSSSQAIATDASVPAYLIRQKQVEKRYDAFLADFQKSFAQLEAVMPKEAPDLWEKIRKDKPVLKGWGYGMLPKIYKHTPPKETFKIQSTIYSWKRTDVFLDNEIHRVSELNTKLRSLEKLSAQDRMAIYKTIADDVKLIRENQKIIEDHVNYNRFWQKSIHEVPDFYRRLTVLHDAVLERQRLLEDFSKSRSPASMEKANQLYEQILSGGQAFQIPNFVALVEKKNKVTLRVPIYTDITDAAFLKNFKNIIERVWSVSDEKKKYGVEVVFHKIPPGHYKHGEHISITDSLKRFKEVPALGAALTTGAESTHASPGSYVALGPQELSENTLAHEFGHILGFVDAYFRGFHDRGSEGYEVLEIVPDPDDIMCRPGEGRVLASHFTRMTAQIKTRVSKSSRSSQIPSK